VPVDIDKFLRNDQPHRQQIGDQSVLRRRLIILATLLFAAASMFAGVPQTASSPASAKTTTPSVTVTDHDNGRDIDLASNETLIVKLSSNPSTGYNWAVLGDPAPLKLQKTSYRKNSQSSQVVGAPGVQTFQFSPGSAGIANLNFAYRRSWEYNVPPAKSFSIRVNVR